ncbi:esterase-like activity of phytase family protein [Flavobacterium cellulosilyticum]|uniref:Esterase-like activity of phytase family protein n=1 Tax=Flavobacterium cellulosilyticum TaxID=2541731 RepID=A0A4R5C6U4_9FLAO|nr:esterase-like activity of phytase family protein [Flavobacterium cellulosilyticum]TDD94409.1 esterase-like activity of phytase family protein [Flavobacterium cellulosilyticum]
MNKLAFFAVILFCIVSCSSIQSTATSSATLQLKFLNSIEIPSDQEFKNTLVGGLSGIDYDAKNDIYYLISDDRSEYNIARFYIAKILLTTDKIKSIKFENVVSFKNKAKENYSNWQKKPATSIDPEDIRYNPKTKNIVWSSEGARVISDQTTILQNPSIQTTTLEGNFVNNYNLSSNLKMQKEDKGPRSNAVLEGITFDKKYRTLFANIESPLFEDDKEATTTKGALIRMYQYEVKSKTNTAQYAYLLDPVAHFPIPENGFSINGVSAIQYYDKNQLLVVERSYSVGTQKCTIKIYLCDFTKATNVKDFTSLQNQKFILASKKLVLNMDDLNVFVDNIEGITFGPKLASGKQSLLFVTDNNFSKLQKTQILLFEVE